MKNKTLFTMLLFACMLFPGAMASAQTEIPGNEKMVIVWTSGDREVALKMVFMYTLNAKTRGWWEDITLVVWGPSAKLLTEDERSNWQGNYEVRLKLYESHKPYHMGNPWSFSEGELPGDPIVVPFAPQHQLLEKAKMVITHCGMNTAMNALAHGLPMVAVPIANEQPGVAARVHYSGCGEVIPVKKLNAENLTVAIAKVWNTDSYRQNAQRIQRAIKKAGGAKTAAALIEDCLSEVRTGLTRVSATQSADAS